jgi:hypothetical protein
MLADYGFATIKPDDDWQSADFIAQHFDGSTFLKVQLKSRPHWQVSDRTEPLLISNQQQACSNS